MKTFCFIFLCISLFLYLYSHAFKKGDTSNFIQVDDS